MNRLTRDQQLALDHAGGMTFTECAEKYGVHTSRCHQVYTKVVRQFRLSWVKDLSAARLAHAISQSNRPRYKDNTPEGFFHRLEFERERDAESRRLESFHQSTDF